MPQKCVLTPQNPGEDYGGADSNGISSVVIFFFLNFIMKGQLTQQPHTLNNMPAVMVSLKTTYS